MIQANELRIGNWVNLCFNKSKGWHIARVIAIHNDNTIDTDTEYGDGGQYYYEAIPLTPEILGKAGFVEIAGIKNEYFRSLYSVRKEQILDDPGFDFYIHWGNKFSRLSTIKYLHQLQNLIFALTDTELKYQP